MEPMQTQTKQQTVARQLVKVLVIIVAIPITAWLAEFIYTNYIVGTDDPNPGRFMIMSNHGYEGYDYTRLNSLLRKVRRVEMLQGQVPQGVAPADYVQQLIVLRSALEVEHRAFVSYYYGMLDLYTQVNMPIKLRRRLHYYRTIIRHGIGLIKQATEEIRHPEKSKKRAYII
jgi:hypothetical protein